MGYVVATPDPLVALQPNRDTRYNYPRMTAKVPRDDLVTLAALGVVAFVCCDLLHEWAGHGAVCLATGGRVATLSTVHLQCMGGWQRLVSGAGIGVNLLAGALCLLWLRHLHNGSIHLRYFVWLLAAYNLFTGCGYVVSSSLSDTGDLAQALRGVAWRGCSAALGLAAYAWSILAATRALRRFATAVGAAQAWRLILPPYFAAAAVACAAAACNAILPSTVLMAVSTTLGAWGFLLLPLAWRFGSPAKVSEPVTRHAGWVLGAAITAAVFVGALGPGIRLYATR